MATVRERHPEQFESHPYIVPRGFKRTVPVEVLCFGMPRTGTVSMTTALDILGFKAYHSLLWCSTHVGDIELWKEALDAKFRGKGRKWTRAEDFDQPYHDFSAIVEIPGICFVPELLEVYPEAKVVLVDRDIDRWYKSFYNSVVTQVFITPLKIVRRLDWFIYMVTEGYYRVWDYYFDGPDAKTLGANAKRIYRDHYAEVRRLVPPDRMLEFKLADGWEPLCKHLGKPIPDVPFPHVNEEGFLAELIGLMVNIRLKVVLAKFAAALTVGGVTAWLAYSRRTQVLQFLKRS